MPISAPPPSRLRAPSARCIYVSRRDLASRSDYTTLPTIMPKCAVGKINISLVYNDVMFFLTIKGTALLPKSSRHLFKILGFRFYQ